MTPSHIIQQKAERRKYWIRAVTTLQGIWWGGGGAQQESESTFHKQKRTLRISAHIRVYNMTQVTSTYVISSMWFILLLSLNQIVVYLVTNECQKDESAEQLDVRNYISTFSWFACSMPTANTRYPQNRAMARLRWRKLWTAVNNFLLNGNKISR